MRFVSVLSLLLLWLPATVDAEPSAQLLIDAALSEAGLDGPLDSWSSRARWANVVPEIDISAEGSRVSDTEDHYRETLAESDVDLFTFKSLQTTNAEDEAQKFQVRLRLRWRPGGLIFDPSELSAERLAQRRSDARATVIARVSKLYSQYIGLRRRLRSSEKTEEDLIEIIRVEAELDALTGGALSRSYKEKNP